MSERERELENALGIAVDCLEMFGVIYAHDDAARLLREMVDRKDPYT